MMQEKLRDKVGRLKGKPLKNFVDDQTKIMKLLNAILDKPNGGTAKLKRETFNPSTGRLTRREVERKAFEAPVANKCADDLAAAILEFQRVNKATLGVVDGNISPTGQTLRLLNALADPSLADVGPQPPTPRTPQSGPLWTVTVKNLLMSPFSTTADIEFFDRMADVGKPKGTYFYKFSGRGLNILGVARSEPFTGNFNMPCRMNDPFGGPSNMELIQFNASIMRLKVTANQVTGKVDAVASVSRGLTLDFWSGGISSGNLTLQGYADL